MAAILMIGSDAALLEGLAQMLAAMGHAPWIAASVEDGRDLAVGGGRTNASRAMEPALIVLVEHDLAAQRPDVARFPIAPGGALVLYRSRGGAAATLSPTLARVTLAELVLPLERQRLAALVQSVDARARAAGRRPGVPHEAPRPGEAPGRPPDRTG